MARSSWLKLPEEVDAGILHEVVESDGVFFETGGFTFSDQRINSNHIRLGYSVIAESLISEGIERIAKAVPKALGVDAAASRSGIARTVLTFFEWIHESHDGSSRMDGMMGSFRGPAGRPDLAGPETLCLRPCPSRPDWGRCVNGPASRPSQPAPAHAIPIACQRIPLPDSSPAAASTGSLTHS